MTRLRLSSGQSIEHVWSTPRPISKLFLNFSVIPLLGVSAVDIASDVPLVTDPIGYTLRFLVLLYCCYVYLPIACGGLRLFTSVLCRTLTHGQCFIVTYIRYVPQSAVQQCTDSWHANAEETTRHSKIPYDQLHNWVTGAIVSISIYDRSRPDTLAANMWKPCVYVEV